MTNMQDRVELFKEHRTYCIADTLLMMLLAYKLIWHCALRG